MPVNKKSSTATAHAKNIYMMMYYYNQYQIQNAQIGQIAYAKRNKETAQLIYNGYKENT